MGGLAENTVLKTLVFVPGLENFLFAKTNKKFPMLIFAYQSRFKSKMLPKKGSFLYQARKGRKWILEGEAKCSITVGWNAPYTCN